MIKLLIPWIFQTVFFSKFFFLIIKIVWWRQIDLTETTMFNTKISTKKKSRTFSVSACNNFFFLGDQHTQKFMPSRLLSSERFLLIYCWAIPSRLYIHFRFIFIVIALVLVHFYGFCCVSKSTLLESSEDLKMYEREILCKLRKNEFFKFKKTVKYLKSPRTSKSLQLLVLLLKTINKLNYFSLVKRSRKSWSSWSQTIIIIEG